MNNQSKKIKTIFNENCKKQNIEYNIGANSKIEINSNDLISLDEYAIQWFIQGSNNANSTKCQLTLFNIDGFLGAYGFLYTISLFYYYLLKYQQRIGQKKKLKKILMIV